MMQGKRTSIFILLGVTFLFWFTLYVYVPTLPTYLRTKTVNLSTVGLVLSMYGLWMAVARLPMGIAVDSIGWGKPMIMAGLFLCSLGALIIGKGNTLWVIALGRALVGISGATWVPLLVVFSRFYSAEEAIYSSSILTFTAFSARVVATSLTGVLNRFGGYQLPFIVATISGGAALCLTLLVKEPRRPKSSASMRTIAELIVRKDVILPTVISILVHYADFTVTLGFLPIYAQEMGAGDVIKSMLITVNFASMTIATLLNTLLTKRMKNITLLSTGVLLFFSGIMIISFAHNIPLLFVGTAMMGFAFGIIYPILLGMSIFRVDRAQRNSAMGIHQSLYAVGMWTGPWISGFIADMIGIRKTFLFTGGFYLVLVYLFIFLLNLSEKRWKESVSET